MNHSINSFVMNSIVGSLYDGLVARGVVNVFSEVKQRVVLTPTLFILRYVTMGFATLSKTDAGVVILYRYDRRFVGLRCLKARPKLKDFVISIAETAKASGVSINVRKAEVKPQRAPECDMKWTTI